MPSIAPRYSDPDLEAASKKIGKNSTWISRFFSIMSNPREWWADMKLRLNQGVFDRYSGIKEAIESLGLEIPASINGYVSARLSTSIQDRFGVLLKHGQLKWVNGVLTPADDTKPFLKIIEPVADQLDEFGKYLVGLRARDLEKVNKKSGFTKPQIDAMIALGDANPHFEGVRLDYKELNDSVVQIAIDAGIINETSRKMWQDDNYIPFFRIMEEGGVGPKARRALEGQYGTRRFKGSDRGIGDPIENILMNWAHLLDASVKNKAVVDTISNLKGSSLMEKVGYKMVKRVGSAEAMRKEVEKALDKAGMEAGVSDMLSSAQTLKGLMEVWALEPPSGKDIIRVMRNGKPEYYKVNDHLLLRSLSAVNEQSMGAWMNIFRAPKRLLTMMVTADPAFMIRNFVRDTLGSFVLARDRMTPGIAAIRGAAKAFKEDPEMVRMQASGGTFSTGGYLNASDPTSLRRFVVAETKHARSGATILNSPKRLWDFWQRLGSTAENANRVGVGLAALKNNPDDMAQAAYEMKDIMDFSMRGDYAWIQILAETVPFFSARLQGLHRLGRGFREHPGAFAAKGTLIMLASIALYMRNREDDRYKELEQWDKDTYYHFFIRGSDTTEEHFRLPKPFEIGVLWGTLPERMIEGMIEEDSGMKEFIERMTWNLGQTLALAPIPQVAKPIMEQWANKSFFTGRDIVGTRLDGMISGLEADAWTSATMQELGKKMGLSPKRMEALVRGYFGTLGSYALAVTDIATRQLYDYPDPPSKNLEDMAVISAIYRGNKDTVPRNTRYTTEFYEMSKEIDELYTSVNNLRKYGEFERANELLEENRDKIKYRGGFAARRRLLAKLNEQIRRVHYDKVMSADAKEKKIKAIQKRKNEITKAGVTGAVDYD